MQVCRRGWCSYVAGWVDRKSAALAVIGVRVGPVTAEVGAEAGQIVEVAGGFWCEVGLVLVVVACVCVIDHGRPGPGGGVAADRAVGELRHNACSLAGLVGYAVNPHLSVDGLHL